MAVIPEDIKFFESNSGLGGAITNNEIVSSVIDNLFDAVNKSEAQNGSVEYRCFYVKNTNNSSTFRGVQVYLLSQTTSPTTSLAFGLGTSAVGGTEQFISGEVSAPVGVSFVESISESNALLIGDIPAGSHKAIWLRRTVQAGTSSSSNDTASIRFDGATIND
jgi:hypothetical protein